MRKFTQYLYNALAIALREFSDAFSYALWNVDAPRFVRVHQG